MGFLIASPSIAKHLSDTFRTNVSAHAYRVILENGDLRWIETANDGSQIVHDDEPGMTLGARVTIAVLRWLPIEWML